MSIDEDLPGLYMDPGWKAVEDFENAVECFQETAENYYHFETRENSMDAGLSYSQSIYSLQNCINQVLPAYEERTGLMLEDNSSMPVATESKVEAALDSYEMLIEGEKYMIRGMMGRHGDFRTPLAFARDFGPRKYVESRAKYIVAKIYPELDEDTVVLSHSKY